MIHTDRSVKTLLTIIAILLAIAVARPMLRLAPEARAEDSDNALGYRSILVSTIKTPGIKEVYVIDSAKSFVVRYADVIQVYRVGDVQVSR